jgi:hypothetical protein
MRSLKIYMASFLFAITHMSGITITSFGLVLFIVPTLISHDVLSPMVQRGIGVVCLAVGLVILKKLIPYTPWGGMRTSRAGRSE